MCGERKWECAEEWFEFDEPGLHKDFSVAIIVVIITKHPVTRVSRTWTEF